MPKPRRPVRKRMFILWSYPLTAAVAALGVLLFALLYRGGGAVALLNSAAPTFEEAAQGQDAALPESAAAQPGNTQPDSGQGADKPGDARQVSSDGRLLPYLDGGLWGYKNILGQIVIQPQFLRALEFGAKNGAFAAVEKDGALLYGLLARDGGWIVEPTWSNARGFSEGYAAVERDEKWGFVDTAGKTVVPCVYREAGDFYCGRARVRPASTFGYIDPDGDMAIAAQFDEAGDFSNDMAFAMQGGKRYIIDKVGEKIATLDKESGERYSEGYAAIHTENGAYAYYNSARKRAFSAVYEAAGPFSDGYAAVKKDGLWGYINTGGAVVIAPQFGAAGTFSQDRAPVRNSVGKWGYIDKGGLQIAEYIYDEAGAFLLGAALVKTGGTVGVIDRSGAFTELYSTG